MSTGLSGAIAIATGAAQGLGLGMAEDLARRGAHVVVADLQKDKAEEAADAIRKEGHSAEAMRLDIGDPQSVCAAYARVVAIHGRLDCAIHNAGVGQHVAPIAELTDAEWQRVIHITLTGTFYCCRAAARIMEKQNGGAIVNIASINGQNPAAWVAAYNVAKAGVISLTRTLALELAAYGVRVNAVCPGPVYTEFNRTVMSERRKTLNLSEDQMVERIRSAIPLGRWGEPADIANAVAFLLGPAAGWMTGEVLRVSGGLEGVAAAPAKRTT
jgi:NAD(P)-dependent dehydrogenase (short-subunit alcohol dehydrogenase family)